MSGASDQQDTIWKFSLGVRYIHDVIDRARWRNNLMWHPHHRISLGVEYNPLASDVNPTANFLLWQETENQPAVVIGTSSDRIGTPDGQAFFLTVSKETQPWTGVPFAPYAGVSYGTFDDELVFIGGAHIRLGKGFSTMIIFDGHKAHPTLSWSYQQWTLGAMLAFGKKPGLFINYRF